MIDKINEESEPSSGFVEIDGVRYEGSLFEFDGDKMIIDKTREVELHKNNKE